MRVSNSILFGESVDYKMIILQESGFWMFGLFFLQNFVDLYVVVPVGADLLRSGSTRIAFAL